MRDYEGMILDQELVACHPEMAGYTRTTEADWNDDDATDEEYTEAAQAAVEAAYDRMRR